MVSKSKLYFKLDGLEAELLERLLPHLKIAAEGNNDLVFCVNGYHSFTQLKHQADPVTSELVSLGSEILSLKQQLGESFEGSPAERICWYCRKWGSNDDHRSESQGLARQFLDEIQKI